MRSHRARPAVIVSPGFIQNDAAFSTTERSLTEALESWGYDVVSLRDFAPRHRRDVFADYVEAARQCIFSLGDRRVGFLGHSMGGLIGVSLAPDAAMKLSALVVAGTPLFPGVTFSHLPKERRAFLGPVDATDLIRLQRGVARVARVMGNVGVPFPGRLIGLGFRATKTAFDMKRSRFPLQVWAPKNLSRRELKAMLRSSFDTDSFGVLADLLELSTTDGATAGSVETGARLSALTAPLLCIAGALDGVAPPRSCRALFHRAGASPKVWHMIEAGDGTEVAREAGHIDLLTSAIAEAHTWPVLRRFLHAHLPAD